MSILEKVAEIAGAVAAVEAEKKVNPDASVLAEAVAAVVGFKGGGALAALADKAQRADAEQASAQNDSQS